MKFGFLLGIFLIFLVLDTFGQVETYNIVYEKFTQHLTTKAFREVTLTTSRQDTVSVFTYSSGQKFIVTYGDKISIQFQTNDTLHKSIYFSLSNEIIQDHRIYGKIRRINHHNRSYESEPKLIQVDTVDTNGIKTGLIPYKVQPVTLDAGLGGYFSDKYGLLSMKSFMSRSGEVIKSINGVDIQNELKQFLIRK